MNINGLNTSLQGINSGLQKLRHNAQTLANTGPNHSPLARDSTEAIIGLKTNSHQVEANIKTLKTQDEMLGTLLDELA